jgi:hypothetical protein
MWTIHNKDFSGLTISHSNSFVIEGGIILIPLTFYLTAHVITVSEAGRLRISYVSFAFLFDEGIIVSMIYVDGGGVVIFENAQMDSSSESALYWLVNVSSGCFPVAIHFISCLFDSTNFSEVSNSNFSTTVYVLLDNKYDYVVTPFFANISFSRFQHSNFNVGQRDGGICHFSSLSTASGFFFFFFFFFFFGFFFEYGWYIVCLYSLFASIIHLALFFQNFQLKTAFLPILPIKLDMEV